MFPSPVFRFFHCFCTVFFLFFHTSFAQSGSLVFNDTLLHEIKITFSYSGWFDSLEADYQLNLSDTFETLHDREFLCNMVFDGIAVDSIGMRQRGNFSNYSVKFSNANGRKKPFKLEFDAFKEQRFDGLKAINLNNGTDDPGFVKEALVYKLLRDMGIPASRTSFARLYVNEVYWGLYELVENVDKTYLKDHFGADFNDGNLYKTNRHSAVTLSWLGENPQEYRKEGLLLKTNDSLDDWSKLLHFIYVVNHTAPENLKKAMDSVFDVHSYLKILAVEVLCYSWDSYWGGGNNFYLYEHPDGQIRWIPWDFNETFTTHNSLLSAFLPEQSDIFLSSRFEEKPLLKTIFSVREWQDEYLQIVCDLCQNFFNPVNIAPVLMQWQTLIRPALAEDTNALADMRLFDNSLTADMKSLYEIAEWGISFNVKIPALLPYISRQRLWAVEQIKLQGNECQMGDALPSTYDLKACPNPAGSLVNISWERVAACIYKIAVYNLYGEIVLETGWIKNARQEETLTLKDIPEGFYIVKKQDADGFLGIAKLMKIDP